MESGFCLARTHIIFVRQSRSSARPPAVIDTKQLLPVNGLLDELEVAIRDAAGDEVMEWHKLAQKFEVLESKVMEHFNIENEGDGDRPPVISSPEKMTEAEREAHQATHAPYHPGCPYCAAARAVRRKHPHKGRVTQLILDVDEKLAGPTKISFDYMYLHDRFERRKDGELNPPHLIMVEHKKGRVWPYRVFFKGVNAEAAWLPKRMVQDWDNSGSKSATIQLKSDQEPSIVQLQTAIQQQKDTPVIPVNSPVGESESNGRVENAVRRVQE